MSTGDLIEKVRLYVSVSVITERGVKCTTEQKEDGKKGVNSSSKLKPNKKKKKKKTQYDPTSIDYPTVVLQTDSIMKGVES